MSPGEGMTGGGGGGLVWKRDGRRSSDPSVPGPPHLHTDETLAAVGTERTEKTHRSLSGGSGTKTET